MESLDYVMGEVRRRGNGDVIVARNLLILVPKLRLGTHVFGSFCFVAVPMPALLRDAGMPPELTVAIRRY
ncbi:MAG: hypothetical protein ACKVT0_02305 [Planctomycetaceae bacterium]